MSRGKKTTPPTSGSGGTPVGCATTPCVTCSITSQTIATQPADRTRTKIGVGEEVQLTFSLGNATWSNSGGGNLSAVSGATITYTASDVAGSVTITATASGCTATKVLTIVPPSTVKMKRYPGTGLRHKHNQPDLGMQVEIYLGPDDVSFYNLQYHEVDVPAVATIPGAYSFMNTLGHDPHPATLDLSATVVAGFGTQANAVDSVYSGYPGGAPPFTPGNYYWDIPYEYIVRGGTTWHRFTTVRHLNTLASNGTTITVTKGGVTVTGEVGDPDSSY